MSHCIITDLGGQGSFGVSWHVTKFNIVSPKIMPPPCIFVHCWALSNMCTQHTFISRPKTWRTHLPGCYLNVAVVWTTELLNLEDPQIFFEGCVYHSSALFFCVIQKIAQQLKLWKPLWQRKHCTCKNPHFHFLLGMQLDFISQCLRLDGAIWLNVDEM